MIGVQAQKDVTSQYITNATLSSLNGWTNVNFNAPQRGNNTVGYASECYAGWGSLEKTNYSLTQDITLPAGHYTLVNYSFFRYGLNADTDASKSLAFLKAGEQQVAIKTLGSITASGYANSQAEGANCFDSKMYRNTLDFTIDADNTVINIGLVGTFDLKQSWMIAGMFELINNDIPATMDAPFDVTGYITNPGFEYRDMTGWTQNPSGYFGTQNNNQSFKVGGYYAEKWQASGALPAGSMSQTLTNLPAGYYKLTANLGGNGTYIDLNGKKASWTSDKDYTVGYVLAEDENLTITAGKTSEGTANWVHFDNFRLQFCGDVQAALTTLIAQLSGYEGTIPSAAYSALQTAVAVYDKDYSDVDELLAAIAAVQNLYAAADLLVSPYATFNALKAKAQTLQAVANDNAGANSTFASAITAQVAAVEEDETATAGEINTATSTLKTAMQTYVFAANPVGDGAQFDCTFLMTNPDLTGLPTWQPAAGWASEETDGNSQVMVNDSKTVGDKSYFYEYWSGTAKASGKFALYNAVTLPEGTFSMSCYAFAEDQDGGQVGDGVYFYANNTQGSCVTATVLTEQTISFVNSSEQEVKIGLKTVAGNTRNWMGIGYVELYKVPAKTYTVDETAVWDYSTSGAGEVTLNRTIKVGVNTLVLPFSMTQDEVEAKFGVGSKVYQLVSYDLGSDNISFTSRDGISANVPCLLQATEAGTSYVLEDRTIVAAASNAPTATGENVSLIGSYAASILVPQNNVSYIINGGLIYQVNSDVTLRNTRAYIALNTNSGARQLVLNLDENPTIINAIEAADAETEGGLKDGKYLIGNKIVLVKNGVKYGANGQKLN